MPGRRPERHAARRSREVGFSLKYVIDAYADLGSGTKFFTPMFEKLVGVGWVREMILAGAPEGEIRARLADDVERYRERRTKYLLYENWKTGPGFPGLFFVRSGAAAASMDSMKN